MEYKILMSGNLVGLEKAVNEVLKNKGELVGGLVMSSGNYCQAVMVKAEKPTKKK